MSFNILIGTCHNHDITKLLLMLKPQLEGFDKIMVFDDYSSSDEILDSYRGISSNLFVVKHKLKDSFAEHWNFGLSLLDYKTWTIKLDGDEMVGPKFIAGIYKEIYTRGKCNAIDLRFIHTLWGELTGEIWPTHIRHCQKGYGEVIPSFDLPLLLSDPDYAVRAGLMTWPDYKVRVWINMPDVFYIGRIHERLNLESGNPCDNPDTFIFHHKHYQSFGTRVELYDRLTKLQKELD